jgi:hypothetical protein
VGLSGTGTLTVADSGQVSASTVNITAPSKVRLNVSGDNMLVLGTASTAGAVTNNGNVAFYADAFLPAGTYRPIADSAGRTMTWSGSGAYNATGGAWNNADKTFVVPAAVTGAAGISQTVTSGQRLVITDSASGMHVGVSVGTISGGTNFAADRMSESSLTQLAPLLASGQQVLDAWDFTTNFAGGGEVLLSYDVGTGFSDLAVWHLQGGVWSAYTPSLLSYESDGVVSFTVGSFSGYAVTGAAVPEPSAVGLLLTTAGLMTIQRQRRRGTQTID